MNKLKSITIHAPRCILAFLLIYTAAKKTKNYDAHMVHIRDIGIIPAAAADTAAIASIAIEAGVAALLLLNYASAQVWGWRILTVLMLVYSYYVFFVLNIAAFVPCSCEGVHGKLNWTNHYWLNGLIATIAIGMLYYHRRIGKQKMMKPKEKAPSKHYTHFK